MDPLARADLTRLRTEMREMKLRLRKNEVRSAWLWVVAIWASSAALAGLLFHAFMTKP